MAPRQLLINIFITFEIPLGKVSLAVIEETGRQSLKESGRLMIKTLLEALQERLSFMLQALHPERFVKNGRHGRLRTFKTSFGKVQVVNHQILDKQSRKSLRLLPLAVDFRSGRRFSPGALRLATRLSVLTSFRQAAREASYEMGLEVPSHATVHRNFREIFAFSEVFTKGRKFRHLMVDTMKVRLQSGRGRDAGWGDVRVVLAAERGEGPWIPVGFFVNRSWEEVRRELERVIDYEEVEVLISDGEPGIEALLREGMRHQRCVWHGWRDLSFVLYQDGFRGLENRDLVDLLSEIPLFRLKTKDRPGIREKVEGILEESRRLWEELLEVFDREVYPRAHSYLKRLGENLFIFLEYFLEKGEWIPNVSNMAENVIGRIKLRVRRIGKRWSERGLIALFRAMARRIFGVESWEAFEERLLGAGIRPKLVALEVKYHWRWPITPL
ncbi:ISH6 family transposase [Thermosulfurimonas dismutans]|uniref:Mutator family transposase n=1 Tax=Thermosulfurimonas dismutans TaxID=999894 RepID=A0A179D4F9_9BACT|nr:hypothetical protein [Thermosulfurimonas dismutans]OAQ20609.1 hypothetical protein TDIS_1224 [Thermosulfurimonas dismutans]